MYSSFDDMSRAFILQISGFKVEKIMQATLAMSTYRHMRHTHHALMSACSDSWSTYRAVCCRDTGGTCHR